MGIDVPQNGTFLRCEIVDGTGPGSAASLGGCALPKPFEIELLR